MVCRLLNWKEKSNVFLRSLKWLTSRLYNISSTVRVHIMSFIRVWVMQLPEKSVYSFLFFVCLFKQKLRNHLNILVHILLFIAIHNLLYSEGMRRVSKIVLLTQKFSTGKLLLETFWPLVHVSGPSELFVRVLKFWKKLIILLVGAAELKVIEFFVVYSVNLNFKT